MKARQLGLFETDGAKAEPKTRRTKRKKRRKEPRIMTAESRTFEPWQYDLNDAAEDVAKLAAEAKHERLAKLADELATIANRKRVK